MIFAVSSMILLFLLVNIAYVSFIVDRSLVLD